MFYSFFFFFKNTDKRDMKELIITKWGRAASQRGEYHNKLLHYEEKRPKEM